MESIYPELTLCGSKNECARTDTVFIHLSEVSEGTVSLVRPFRNILDLCCEIQPYDFKCSISLNVENCKTSQWDIFHTQHLTPYIVYWKVCTHKTLVVVIAKPLIYINNIFTNKDVSNIFWCKMYSWGNSLSKFQLPSSNCVGKVEFKDFGGRSWVSDRLNQLFSCKPVCKSVSSKLGLSSLLFLQ